MTIKSIAIRAVKTMAQTAVSLITVGMNITEIDWLTLVGVSLTSGVISMLMNISDWGDTK